MGAIEIIVRATIKMIAIWGSLLVVGTPIAKVAIEISYKIWRKRNGY